MKTISLCIVILASVAISSCSSRQKEVKEINALASELDSVMNVAQVLDPKSRQQADKLVEEYKEYAAEYPEDTLSPHFLMKASFLAGAIPDLEEQTKILEEVAEKYPDSKYAPQALALAAKAYVDNSHDLDKARRCLEKLQKDYPESPYSVNIDLQIEYLGDDDGLFTAIMERNGMNNSVDTVKQGTGQ